MKKKRAYKLSEEEKAAFTLALEVMQKLMAEEEPEQLMSEEVEERPCNTEPERDEMSDEERWISAAIAELRSSK